LSPVGTSVSADPTTAASELPGRAANDAVDDGGLVSGSQSGMPAAMLVGLYIIVDDEVDSAVYADPAPADLDEGVWGRVSEIVSDVLDQEIDARGTVKLGDAIIGWRSLVKTGLTFVAVTTDAVRPQHVEIFLQKLAKRYVDEVDDWRSPDKDGVSEIVVDVIPPWEEPE
jgi:hypothetical protein